MKKTIREIADVQIGYHFDKKIVPEPYGKYRIIQMSNIGSRGVLDTSSLIRTSLDRDVDRYMVRKNDILFISRGSNNIASVVETDLDNTIPVSYFFIARIKSAQILPGYVAWFINQPVSQAAMKKNLKGSNIPMIAKDDFLNFVIEIPSLVVQQTIIELDALKQKESELLHMLADKKEFLVNTICMRAVKKNNHKKD